MAVTTYRGRDPRDFALIAFGGNGPVAAAAIARALAIRTVLVPPAPGVFSALGLLTSAVEHEHSASVLRRVDELDDAALTAAFAALAERAREGLAAEGHAAERVQLRGSAELRYAGQAYELTVPVAEGDSLAQVAARFHDEHRKTYGHASPGDPVDLVSVRIAAQAAAQEGSLDYAALSARAGHVAAAAPSQASRRAYFGSGVGFVETPVIARAALGTDWRVGPLIVEEYDATCVIPPGARARLDALGNIAIDVPPEDA
jgi:N-methylhydantoinase A